MLVTSVTARAPAKINLQLTVGAARPDGYHELVTVFHAVSLFDEVTVAAVDGCAWPTAGVRVVVTGEGSGDVPVDADNLAARAAAALARAAGLPATPAVEITIRKRIPVAAGLAGGSADAAATLVACNELWGTGFSPSQLCQVAAGVGSDVPFALLGGTAVGRGRGERLAACLVSGEYHWVLAFADGQLATPAVYAAFDRLHGAGQRGEATGGTASTGGPEPNGDLLAALRMGDPARLGRALGNDLQLAALSLFPALRKTLAAGMEAGALGAVVAGSGPTCVFLATDAAHAVDLAVALSGAGVCRTVTPVTGPVPGALTR